MPKPTAKKKSAETPKQVDSDDYNAVVAQASLTGIRLISSSMDARPEAYSAEGAEQHYKVNYELVANHYDMENSRLTGVFRFSASATAGDVNMLSVDGDYLLDYHLSEVCEQEAADLFIERLGPFAAYPYFRALFGLLTGQAGLLTPPLPILAEAPRSVSRAKNLQFKEGGPLSEAKSPPRVRRKKSPALSN